MIILKILLKFFKTVNSEAEPWQIASGFVIGLFLGLTPLLSMHNAVLIGLLLVVRINISSALVAWGLFSALALLTDPQAHAIGTSLLNSASFNGLWHFVSETPVLALFNLNNTLVLGSIILSIAGTVPVFILVYFSVKYYRTKLKEKVEQWKIVKIIKGMKIVKKLSALSRLA